MGVLNERLMQITEGKVVMSKGVLGKAEDMWIKCLQLEWWWRST